MDMTSEAFSVRFYMIMASLYYFKIIEHLPRFPGNVSAAYYVSFNNNQKAPEKEREFIIWEDRLRS